MKKSGGITFANSELETVVAVTVVLGEDGDVEKITDQSGEVFYEKGGGGEE